jgi:aryl-alcohol dehydrogenase-like predicted oxidoreductase
MGMSAYYAGVGSDDAGSIRTIHRALDLGITFLDTAEIYGPYTNIAPIPGTKRIERLEENAAADGITLSRDQLARLNAIGPAAGDRYADMSNIDR